MSKMDNLRAMREAKYAEPAARYEIYDYPGGHEDLAMAGGSGAKKDVGTRRAQQRVDGFESAHSVAAAITRERRLTIGTTFDLDKHPADSGGYLVQRGDRHITIRVPAKAFRPALDKVETLGDELHREVNVSDVTEEFSDLQIRLQNARAVRLRLEELLRQAANVEDALAVQKELERVTEEIERTLGRLKLLSELVAFSTITVRFEARPTDVVGSRVTLPFPWLHELGLPSLLSM